MSGVYCGAKKVPKTKRLGSMKECVETGKILYWGIKKVDAKTLSTIGSAAKKITSSKLMVKVMGIRGKMRKIKKDLPYEKNAKEKKALEKRLKELQKENEKASAEYEAVKKIEDSKYKRKLSRNKSKKSKGSKK